LSAFEIPALMLASGMTRRDSHSKSIDNARLRQLAVHYAARYLTNRSRLARYLERKVREGEWSDDEAPAIETIVGQLAELRYVDDQAFARAKFSTLRRKGWAESKIRWTLLSDGVDETAISDQSEEPDELASALRFAERKRLGPFYGGEQKPNQAAKWMGAFMRAGHRASVAAKVIVMSQEDLADVRREAE
jgi:regulatory protein